MLDEHPEDIVKPVIGISPTPSNATFDHGSFRRYTLSDTYTDAILAAGGVPIVLPLDTDVIDDLLESLDGIIFSGGGDIDPKYWGDSPIPEADEHDPDRDAFELQAIPKVLEKDMPMLGICRGIQTINVALGGSLYQDLPTEVEDAQQHRQHKEGKLRDERSHDVEIEPGTNILRDISGASRLTVNSFHHQAIKSVSQRARTIARSDDGIVEGIDIPEMTFGLAVQWHPEMLAADYDDQAAIFRAFVGAASAYAQRKSER